MFYKIVICIPIIIKLSVICVIMFYIYSVVGVEIFTTLPPIKYNPTEYGLGICPSKYKEDKNEQMIDSTQCNYADFNTLLGALLILL